MYPIWMTSCWCHMGHVVSCEWSMGHPKMTHLDTPKVQKWLPRVLGVRVPCHHHLPLVYFCLMQCHHVSHVTCHIVTCCLVVCSSCVRVCWRKPSVVCGALGGSLLSTTFNIKIGSMEIVPIVDPPPPYLNPRVHTCSLMGRWWHVVPDLQLKFPNNKI